ncbi:replication factor C large subunit [Candidatus Micrarchaeota archaeon]|nr:replication factor C large subunit [Candidatus Micrarchaeota archaeon]
MWTMKHAPTRLADIIGHGDAVEKLRAWGESWERGERPRPVLMAGPAGVGKTSMARCLANDFGWECFELNASDTRDAATLDRTAGVAASAGSLFGKRRMIVFDEVDGLFSQDRGGAASIVRVLEENACPIVLTANDAWDKKLAGIRAACELVNVKRVHPMVCAKLLLKVVDKENVKADPAALLAIAKNAAGDVRCALNDLQLLAQGKQELSGELILSRRDREANIFDVVRTVLKSRSFKESLGAIQELHEEPSFVLRWLEENLPKDYINATDRYNAFQKLSRVDIFLSRVLRRQNFELWRYATDLMAGVSTDKHSGSGFVKYSFPQSLRAKSAEFNARESLLSKIGKQCHASSGKAKDYLPLLFELAQQTPARAACLAAQFGLDEEELSFLGVGDVKHCLKAAEEVREKEISSVVSKMSGLNVYG